MRGLSINDFWNLRPKLPFRYKATIISGMPKVPDDILTYAITSINLPKMEGQISEGSMYLGNSTFTIPVWNIASRKLEITFEETDQMNVSKFLDALVEESWAQNPWRITVLINFYEEHLRTEDVVTKAYICHLLSYDEPQFKRDGAAGQVTMSATFIIDTIIDNWDGTVITGHQSKKVNSELNPELNTLNQQKQSSKFTYGNVDFGAEAPTTGGMGGVGTGYMQGQIDLDKLIADAKAKGYDVSTIEGAAAYIAKYGMADKAQHQCTRGISLYMQLASRARGESKSQFYQTSCAADDFGNGSSNKNIGESVRNSFKETTFNKKITGKSNMNTFITQNLKKNGDYVTFSYTKADGTKSQHIVYYLNGKYYSDFAQGSATGCGGATSIYSNIKVYNQKS